MKGAAVELIVHSLLLCFGDQEGTDYRKAQAEVWLTTPQK